VFLETIKQRCFSAMVLESELAAAELEGFAGCLSADHCGCVCVEGSRLEIRARRRLMVRRRQMERRVSRLMANYFETVKLYIYTKEFSE